MRFLIMKNDGVQCGACETELMRGEEAVQTFIQNNRGYRRVITYHVTCYIPWYTEMFNRKWSEWKHGTGRVERPNRGRKPTYLEPTKEQVINRLRSAITYHKSKGHNIKVGILQTKLKGVIKLPVH